jgi:hypothetical protein
VGFHNLNVLTSPVNILKRMNFSNYCSWDNYIKKKHKTREICSGHRYVRNSCNIMAVKA